MPLYEYYCQTCSETFDLLRPISRMDDEALCPRCNGGLQRKLSVFASFSTSAEGETSAIAGGGGGCCGGGCGDGGGGACAI